LTTTKAHYRDAVVLSGIVTDTDGLHGLAEVNSCAPS
jgi:hypothetical protein